MSRRVENRHLVKAIWAFLPRRSPASGQDPFIFVHRASFCVANVQETGIDLLQPNNVFIAFDARRTVVGTIPAWLQGAADPQAAPLQQKHQPMIKKYPV
jgi:hypothetical protein